jgi:hypothetical protein
VKTIWEEKAGFFSGLEFIWPGISEWLPQLTFMLLYFLLFIFIAVINDWNIVKSLVGFLPTVVIGLIQSRISVVEKVSADGEVLLLQEKRSLFFWRPIQRKVIHVLIANIKRCNYNALIGFKLITKEKSYKLTDSSGGDMSTALLRYLSQFDHIKGLANTPVQHARESLEKKVLRFTLGFEHPIKRQWYDHWVYPIDPQGFGNGLPELKDRYLQALAAILQKAEKEAQDYPYPWQVGIRYVPKDMSLNALIFHDPGPRGTGKPMMFYGVKWNNQWPQELKRAFPRTQNYICGLEASKGLETYWIIPKNKLRG